MRKLRLLPKWQTVWCCWSLGWDGDVSGQPWSWRCQQTDHIWLCMCQARKESAGQWGWGAFEKTQKPLIFSNHIMTFLSHPHQLQPPSTGISLGRDFPNILNYEISTKALTKSMDPVWKEPYSQDIRRKQSQFNPVQLNSIQQVVTRPFVLLVSSLLLLWWAKERGGRV